MSSLNNQQKQLLFNYCSGLTSDTETAEAKLLTASNKEAAEIYSKLKSALTPLTSLQSESCPDALVESTIERLNLAYEGQIQLQHLLATEQKRPYIFNSRFLPRLSKVLATAAVIIISICILYSASSHARQIAWQKRCMVHLSSIFNGLTNYADEHQGQLPAVAAAVGEPWWKVGEQGKENHSNTRAPWLLVALNYNKAEDFVCPGSTKGKTLPLDTSRVSEYNDFPAREYITYSFQIRCRQADSGKLLYRKVLAGDLSPLFEKLPDYSESLGLTLTKELLTHNSINHNRQGQNVLYADGRAEFVRTRRASTLDDDIYTLQNVDIYEGHETPDCETDFFLAP